MTARSGVDDHADFELGSVSKALTGMLYADARQRGLITRDITLGELLPLDRHGDVRSVTLASLAVHRSGLPRLPPGMQPLRRTLRLWSLGVSPYGETLVELLEQLRGVPVGRPRPQYSNLGFQLLGHAVAVADATTYADRLQQAFGSGFYAPADERELRATSVSGVSRTGRPRAPWVGEAVAPAGGVRAGIATVRDFLTTVLTGTAVGLDALDPKADFGRAIRIGAGWITLERGPRDVTWHNGATGGFRSWIGFDRRAGTGVAVLAAGENAVDRLGFGLLAAVSAR